MRNGRRMDRKRRSRRHRQVMAALRLMLGAEARAAAWRDRGSVAAGGTPARADEAGGVV